MVGGAPRQLLALVPLHPAAFKGQNSRASTGGQFSVVITTRARCLFDFLIGLGVATETCSAVRPHDLRGSLGAGGWCRHRGGCYEAVVFSLMVKEKVDPWPTVDSSQIRDSER